MGTVSAATHLCAYLELTFSGSQVTTSPEHFLLLCHAFRVPRCDILASVLPVLRSFDLTDIPNSTLLQILLYGDKKLPFEVNKFILQATIMYILRTERLT